MEAQQLLRIILNKSKVFRITGGKFRSKEAEGICRQKVVENNI